MDYTSLLNPRTNVRQEDPFQSHSIAETIATGSSTFEYRNSEDSFLRNAQLDDDDIDSDSELKMDDSRHSRVFFVLKKFVKYIGPGLMVSVSYMDPGNFSSSISSAQFQYKLLFSLMVSNMMAGFLQILASKLGICTGQDLASNCRTHLPKYLNWVIYVFAELAVAATDMAEIIGTAIAFNILFGLPLLGGVLLTFLDIIFVLMAYRPNGPLVVIQVFEAAVGVLVLGTVVCFIIELVNVSPSTNWKAVFRGFLPSKEIFSDTKGLYLSAALLGSNLMPHSLYLGSGVVQSRMKAFDIRNGFYSPPVPQKKSKLFLCGSLDGETEQSKYKPSINAIKDTMSYTIAEMVISLVTVALFVNASILIVAGTALSTPMDDDGDGDLENADLFTLHYLLSSQLSKAAGTVFALALLCSGLCGGTVVTIASQMIMEGHARFSMHPALRRIITRLFAITPCIVVVLVQGREGLSSILNASQVVLSLLLPFISAPLIYLTCKKSIMRVSLNGEDRSDQRSIAESIPLSTFSEDTINLLSDQDEQVDESERVSDSVSECVPDSVSECVPDSGSGDPVTTEVNQVSSSDQATTHITTDTDAPQYKDMSNNLITSIFAVLVWVIISFMNFWLLISLAMGKDVPV
ncbi:hypothetical protein OGAPHI_007163 [Ogataea philodendri]|uniref:Uncharacterized protein n=1 Tax=Ogataea philodendri TaxID=1378263 RepID=A0A9P8NW74_9ASCO|nr:uncharacterized protein OGAPHI_007163 [Ogataea philodendri]KAH3660577.1 hypothetical protein OGAPHI_007163 [Ogataea philodendri]